jgi:hypothetical protein
MPVIISASLSDKKTTDSSHGGPVTANLLDQDFGYDGPDQKCGADISYIWTAEGGFIWPSFFISTRVVSSAGRQATD